MNKSHITRNTHTQSLTARVSIIALLLAFATATVRADWPDYAPSTGTKFVQLPDLTPNGLDVLATGNTILADDFLCTETCNIDGIHIWGSWFNNIVDPFPVFLVNIWSNVPSNPSQPGESLWTCVFGPVDYQVISGSDDENFYDPNNPGIVSPDANIYQYNLHPPVEWLHFQQQGSPTQPIIYWLSVTVSTAPGTFFGWKTSANHQYDNAVFGHMSGNMPLGDWNELAFEADSLDLAFAITSSTNHSGINPSMRNTTSLTANAFEFLIAGSYSWLYSHYDGPYESVPNTTWPNFKLIPAGNNTILRWSGLLIPPNTNMHVGFSVPGPSITVLEARWMTNDTKLGCATFLGAVDGTHSIGNGQVHFANNVTNCSFGPLFVGNVQVEYYSQPVLLNQLNRNFDTNRTPIRRDLITNAPVLIPPGQTTNMSVPVPPTNATYFVLIYSVNTNSFMDGDDRTLTYLMVPISPLPSPHITSVAIVQISATNMIVFSGTNGPPGHPYNLLTSTNLLLPLTNWTLLRTDVFNSDGNFTNTVPFDPISLQRFYLLQLP